MQVITLMTDKKVLEKSNGKDNELEYNFLLVFI